MSRSVLEVVKLVGSLWDSGVFDALGIGTIDDLFQDCGK